MTIKAILKLALVTILILLILSPIKTPIFIGAQTQIDKAFPQTGHIAQTYNTLYTIQQTIAIIILVKQPLFHPILDTATTLTLLSLQATLETRNTLRALDGQTITDMVESALDYINTQIAILATTITGILDNIETLKTQLANLAEETHSKLVTLEQTIIELAHAIDEALELIESTSEKVETLTIATTQLNLTLEDALIQIYALQTEIDDLQYTLAEIQVSLQNIYNLYYTLTDQLAELQTKIQTLQSILTAIHGEIVPYTTQTINEAITKNTKITLLDTNQTLTTPPQTDTIITLKNSTLTIQYTNIALTLQGNGELTLSPTTITINNLKISGTTIQTQNITITNSVIQTPITINTTNTITIQNTATLANIQINLLYNASLTLTHNTLQRVEITIPNPQGHYEKRTLNIHGNRMEALKITSSGARYASITNNYIIPTTSTNALELQDITFSKIEGNIINLTYGGTTGIYITGGDRLIIADNILQAYQKTAINAQTSYSTIVGNNWGGGSVNISGTGNTITGNT